MDSHNNFGNMSFFQKRIFHYLRTFLIFAAFLVDFGPSFVAGATRNNHRAVLESIKKRQAESAQSSPSPDLTLTDIFYACEAGRLDAVKNLLRADPKLVLARKANGDTPLHWVARATGKSPDYVGITRALVDAGAEIDAINKDGDTPLLEASFNDNLDRVEVFLAAGANVDAPNKSGWTPLYSAISFGNDHGPQGLDIALLLISKGADVNFRGADAWTPLHMAVKKLGEVNGQLGKEAEARGYQRIIQTLLMEVDNIDAVTSSGNTALHFAARAGLLTVTKKLTNEGCALDPANSLGETPLLLAIREGHVKVSCFLIGSGADIQKTDASGISVAEVARRRGIKEILDCVERNVIDRGEIENGNGGDAGGGDVGDGNGDTGGGSNANGGDKSDGSDNGGKGDKGSSIDNKDSGEDGNGGGGNGGGENDGGGNGGGGNGGGGNGDGNEHGGKVDGKENNGGDSGGDSNGSSLLSNSHIFAFYMIFYLACRLV